MRLTGAHRRYLRALVCAVASYHLRGRDETWDRSHVTYYVGLLSAAWIHGATDSPPENFQIITDLQLRPPNTGRPVDVYVKRQQLATSTLQLRVESGLVRVSTPEATAIDLVQLPTGADFHRIREMLAHLGHQMSSELLVREASRAKYETAQRLGYLLERAGHGERVSELAAWLETRTPPWTDLLLTASQEQQHHDDEMSERWRLRVHAGRERKP